MPKAKKQKQNTAPSQPQQAPQGYPAYNPYAPQPYAYQGQPRYPYSPYSPYSPYGAQPAPAQAQPVADTSKKRGKKKDKKVAKPKKRKESAYFYIHRKGTMFLVLLLAIAMIGLVGLDFIGMMPEYTSMIKAPDLTPLDERAEDYEDATIYINSSQLVFGLLATFDVDLYAGMKETIDASIEEGDFTEEEIEAKYDSIAMFAHDKYDAVLAKFEENGQSGLGVMAFKFAGIVPILVVLIAAITALKAIMSFFGRRLFKRFALTGLILVVLAAVVVFAGLGALMSLDAELTAPDFAQIMDYVMQGLASAPATAPETPLLAYTVGFGALALAAIPVVLILLSPYTRRKVSYGIFD